MENATEDTIKKEDNVVESEKADKDSNTVIENTLAESNSKDKDSKSGEDVAISLAKKKWGENDDTVYYYVEEQISDNVYIISVRDSETTEDLGEYKVNIKTKKVEKN